MKIVCVICSERLMPSDDVFYTPCGHIFHFACLTQWLERSRTCPHCREKVSHSKIHRIYFNFCDDNSMVEDSTTLQAMVDSLKFQLMIKEQEVKQAMTKHETAKKETSGLRAEVKKLENDLTHKDTAIQALKEQTRFFKDQSMEAESAKKEAARMKKKLDEYRSVQVLINEATEDVDEIISNTKDPAVLLTYISVMKRELTTSVGKRKELRTSMKKLQQELTNVSMERNYLLGEHEKRIQLEEMLAISEIEKNAVENRLREFENGTTSSHKPKNFAKRKNNGRELLTNKFSDADGATAIEETACSIRDTTDIIDLSEDSPLNRKKTRPLEKTDVVVISPAKEDRHGNEENSPLSGYKYNVGGELPKRKAKLLTGTSAYSFIAKKPRLAQAVAAGRSSSNVTFDGFGGHSKNDKFPSPKNKFTREVKKPSRPSSKKTKVDAGKRKIGDFINLDP